jgi:hypothetical protein
MASTKISALPLEVGSLEGAVIPIVNKEGQNAKLPLNRVGEIVDLSSLGLDKVNNTADLDKPLSIAAQEALADKMPADHEFTTEEIVDFVDNVNALVEAGATVNLKQLDW